MSNPTGGNYNAGNKFQNGYVSGMQVAWASTTTLTIAAGSCLDSTKNTNIDLPTALTLNAAVVGANGIESGALANSTWYYVHMIWNSMDPDNYKAGLISLSATAPILPVGYDSFRLLDYQRTDGSALFLKNYNFGAGNARKKYWDAAISVLSNGTATSLTAVDLDAAVPPVDLIPVTLRVEFTPNVAGNYVGFTPFGSTAATANLRALSGDVATVKSIGELEVISKLDTTAKILYINSAASGDSDVLAAGFEFNI